jgi:hypothetical protein
MMNIFRFEDLHCNENIFKRFIELGKIRKNDVIKYFKELVSFDYQPSNPIKEDAQ